MHRQVMYVHVCGKKEGGIEREKGGGGIEGAVVERE